MTVPLAVSRRPRLATLSQPSTIPSYQAQPRHVNPRQPVQPPKSTERRPNCCDDPTIIHENGSEICENCGVVFKSSSELQSEITFGENAAGAAVVVGGFVGEDQRHANTMGGTMRGLSGMESREKTLWRGKDEIAKLIQALRLRQTINDMAVGLYKLALAHDFVRGRTVKNTAACCIYLADRKQQDSQLLLMDLAEKCQVSIWDLGRIYKEFLNTLMEVDPANLHDNTRTSLQIEQIVLKFCRKLEFGHDSFKVAQDACSIMTRMGRDWMVDGRQPAGLMGAAIIMAARMNNFRRTVREVVYCVKVADSTINQRLHEFRRTKASTLTVDQFRKYGQRLKDDIEPPSVYKRREKEEKKRKRLALLRGEEDVTSEAELVASGNTPENSAAKRRRLSNGTTQGQAAQTQPTPTPTPSSPDDDGFLVPDIPIDPNATAEDALNFDTEHHLEYVVAAAAPEAQVDEEAVPVVPAPKKRGRPPKKRAPVIIPDEELEIEQEIENELRGTLRDWEKIFGEFATNEEHPILKAAGDRALAIARERMAGVNVPDTEEVGEDEFEDDEDVRTCVNTPQEVMIKEKQWITDNEDWLREQQEKMLQKELEEAEGKPKKVKHRRKRTQMGDGSVLEGKPAKSSREAVTKMLKKNAKFTFSSHINYEKLKELFPGGEDEQEEEEGSPVEASPARADQIDSGVGTQQATQKEGQVQVLGGEEEDADGEIVEEFGEPEYQEEEPYDDTNMYLSDEDQGFDYNDDF